MTTYRQISTHDPEYALEKELRNRVLRLPLGLHLSEQDMRDEDEQVHLRNEQLLILMFEVMKKLPQTQHVVDGYIAHNLPLDTIWNGMVFLCLFVCFFSPPQHGCH